MTTKYTKKEFMENIRNLTSPYETNQPEKGRGLVTKVTDAIQRMVGTKQPEVK